MECFENTVSRQSRKPEIRRRNQVAPRPKSLHCTFSRSLSLLPQRFPSAAISFEVHTSLTHTHALDVSFIYVYLREYLYRDTITNVNSSVRWYCSVWSSLIAVSMSHDGLSSVPNRRLPRGYLPNVMQDLPKGSLPP